MVTWHDEHVLMPEQCFNTLHIADLSTNNQRLLIAR